MDSEIITQKSRSHISPVESLIDKASQLDLTVPEMTALLGGLRVMDINTNNSSLGYLPIPTVFWITSFLLICWICQHDGVKQIKKIHTMDSIVKQEH